MKFNYNSVGDIDIYTGNLLSYSLQLINFAEDRPTW